MDVVAHEVQLAAGVRLCGVRGELAGREGEDEPPTSGVDGGKPENVAEEGPRPVRFAREEDDMGAGDHGWATSIRTSWAPSQTTRRPSSRSCSRPSSIVAK